MTESKAEQKNWHVL